MAALRNRIEAAKAYAGIASHQELARRIEMSPASFNRRLYGDYEFRRGDLLAIAEACGVPIEFLEEGFEGVSWGVDVDELSAAEEAAGPAEDDGVESGRAS